METTPLAEHPVPDGEENELMSQWGYNVCSYDNQRGRYPLSLLPPRSGEDAHDFWRFALDGPEIVRGRLAWLADFLPVFGEPKMAAWRDMPEAGRSAELWHEATASICGIIWRRFHVGAYETGWVDLDAPWSSWKGKREGRAFQKACVTKAKRATPLQMHKVITAVCRGERFCDGQIEACFMNGWFEAFTKRAAVLLQAEEFASKALDFTPEGSVLTSS